MSSFVLPVPTPGETPEVAKSSDYGLKDSVRAYIIVALLDGHKDIPVSQQIQKVFDSSLRKEFEAKGWTINSFSSQMTPILAFSPTPVEEPEEDEPGATVEEMEKVGAMVPPEPNTPKIKKSTGKTT